MRVLAGLGLADTIIQRGNGIEVPWIFMYDSSGSFLGKVPQGTKERYGYPSLMTTRLDIHEVLLEDAEKRGIEVRYGVKVRSLQESEDGVVVHWSENSEDKELKVDLVVGADGIWSVVRQRQGCIVLASHFELIKTSSCLLYIFAVYTITSKAHALSQHTKVSLE
jgi:2-polyprenyl-6-methoxyphenol hydroxylase-like FAD-dependent oxidoreductase